VNSTPTVATANALLADASSGGQYNTLNFAQRWNLISLPLNVPDAHKSVLFPSASSDAFRYSQTHYQQSSILETGVGYWLKFGSAQAVSITGTPLASQSVQLIPGWNMIGSISVPVATSAVTVNPLGIISSGFYGYSGGYNITSSIEPGKGYWINATESGTLTLNAASTSPKQVTGHVEALAQLNSLTISDATGNTQVLYFGATSQKMDLNYYAMPPSAPPEAFDVRFASNRLVELHPAAVTSRSEYRINLQSVKTPIKISWSIQNPAANYSLASSEGRLLAGKGLKGKGSVNVYTAGMGGLTLSAEPRETPIRYALHQNYPNPFNPTTEITFDIPVSSPVTLKVFNILGQEVRTLLNNETLDAGQHTLQFNASELGSGIYFYNMQADKYTSVKKMILLK